MFRFLATVFALFFLSFSPAMANEPTLISTHGDWSVFTFLENGNRVCFMASQPQRSEGKYTKRGEVFALITHRPAEGSRDVVSFVAGYTYKKNSDVTVKVDKKKFTLFTNADTAWMDSASKDKALTKAIRGGETMSVQGRSTRGTLTTDTYSLKGSTAAYDATARACGL